VIALFHMISCDSLVALARYHIAVKFCVITKLQDGKYLVGPLPHLPGNSVPGIKIFVIPA